MDDLPAATLTEPPGRGFRLVNQQKLQRFFSSLALAAMAYGSDGYDVLAYARSNIGLNVVLMVSSLVTFIFYMHVQQAPAKFAWSYFGFIIVASGAYFMYVLRVCRPNQAVVRC